MWLRSGCTLSLPAKPFPRRRRLTIDLIVAAANLSTSYLFYSPNLGFIITSHTDRITLDCNTIACDIQSRTNITTKPKQNHIANMSDQPYDPYIPSGQSGSTHQSAPRDGNQRTAALQAVGQLLSLQYSEQGSLDTERRQKWMVQHLARQNARRADNLAFEETQYFTSRYIPLHQPYGVFKPKTATVAVDKVMFSKPQHTQVAFYPGHASHRQPSPDRTP